ncbi:MAG: N-acetyltransferase family protein [Rhizobiaceae bacterium]
MIVSLRAATADDAETIHAALRKLGAHVGEEHEIVSTPADLRRYGFGDRPAFRVVVAEVDGAFAGLCLFFPSFSTWKGRPGVYVQDLFVAEEFRGMKVGEKLIRAVAAITRDEGGVYMRLAVDSRNYSAQRFYDRLGMELVDDDMIRAAYGDVFETLARNET